MDYIVTGYYPAQGPFPHTVIDGLVDRKLVEEVVAELPEIERRCSFVRYDSPLERKRVTNSTDALPPNAAELYRWLLGDEFVTFLRELTEIPELEPDRTLWGAGLAITERGGKLDLHRDLAIHPKTGQERRVNLALFLNPEWQDDWGGHLELWSERDGRPAACRRKLRPKLGRIVLFDPSGFHGYPDPIKCPEGVQRTSLQIFYYTAPRAGAAERKRAEFVGRPGELADAAIEELRRRRAA